MAIIVSNNAYLTISGYDLTDHCVQMTLNDGQETREITHLRTSFKNFRAAMGTASVECTFLNDASSGSVENILRSHMLMQNTPSSHVPASSPTAAAAGLGAGNLSTGTYRYSVTYLMPAFETAPSTYAEVTITSSTNAQVYLTAIPVSPDWYCVGRNVYRSLINGGTTTSLLLTSITNNTATTYTDNASSSSLVGNDSLSSSWKVTGFPVVVRKLATAQGADNPQWTLTALIDGDVNVLDSKPGEIDQVKVSFKPFSTLVMSTTS
jgi:hypothetical protein